MINKVQIVVEVKVVNKTHKVVNQILKIKNKNHNVIHKVIVKISKQKRKKKKKTKKDIKKKEVQNQSEDHKVIFIVIIFVLFFVIATIILVLRRKYLLKQREKLLSQENINKKYIAYYDYLNELKQYNSEIENNYRYIALKAAYSNTVILQEELDEIRNYVEECLTLIQENNSSLKILIYQYIYVLF